MIFNKLDFIHKTPTPLSKRFLRPVFEFKKNSKDCVMTREQRLELEAGNKFYRNQLVKQSSHYNLDVWNKDFKKSQNFKKIICEFPCIDFHKTQRSYIGDGGFYGENKTVKYNNVNLNIHYNAFDTTQFRRKSPAKINNNNTEEKKEKKAGDNNEKLITVEFIKMGNQPEGESIKISCKKDNLFSEVVDKFLKESKLDKTKILGYSTKNDMSASIDMNKTVKNNGIEESNKVYINMEKEMEKA